MRGLSNWNRAGANPVFGEGMLLVTAFTNVRDDKPLLHSQRQQSSRSENLDSRVLFSHRVTEVISGAGFLRLR